MYKETRSLSEVTCLFSFSDVPLSREHVFRKNIYPARIDWENIKKTSYQRYAAYIRDVVSYGMMVGASVSVHSRICSSVHVLGARGPVIKGTTQRYE